MPSSFTEFRIFFLSKFIWSCVLDLHLISEEQKYIEKHKSSFGMKKAAQSEEETWFEWHFEISVVTFWFELERKKNQATNERLKYEYDWVELLEWLTNFMQAYHLTDSNSKTINRTKLYFLFFVNIANRYAFLFDEKCKDNFPTIFFSIVFLFIKIIYKFSSFFTLFRSFTICRNEMKLWTCQ